MIDVSSLDIRQLAIGVLNVNVGSAIVRFPDSTTAHPSLWAVVSLTGKKPVGYGVGRYFPFKVRWDLWEAVLVPVLQNPDYQIVTRVGRNPINQASLNAEDYETLLARVERGIINQMELVGVLLPGSSEEIDIGTGVSAETVELWPEGHLRLVYRSPGR